MKFKFYIFLFLLFPISLKAQQIYPLSLQELFERGITNSLRIKASQIQEKAAVEKERNARNVRFPQIHFNATTGYIGQSTVFQHGLSHPFHPDLADWSHNYNIELAQPLYNGGKIEYSIRKAILEKQIAQLNTLNNVDDIKLFLLQQYLDLFTLHKQKEIFSRNIEESEIRLKDIHRMKEEGIVTRNDEIRSEIQLTNDKLAYREAKDNLYIVSQQLDILLGLDEDLTLIPDTTLLYTPIQLQNCEAYIYQAYQTYPEIKLIRYRTRLALIDKRLVKADYLPTLSLHAGNTLARPISSTMKDLFNNNWNIALNLSYNLSSLYHNKHLLREAQQSVNFYKNSEEQMKQDIRIKVRSAYIRHQEAIDRVKALLLSVSQTEENYRIVHNRYMNQLSILTDLLDASNIRLQEELRLTAARAEVIYTYYQLLRISGTL